jgi:hypothetical protein
MYYNFKTSKIGKTWYFLENVKLYSKLYFNKQENFTKTKMQKEAKKKEKYFCCFVLPKGKEEVNKNQTMKKKKYFYVFSFIRKTQRITK